MEDLKQNWDLILQTFKERYELQDISFNSWIKPIEVYTVENDTITLIMSSTSMNPDMAVSYVEKKYLEMLRITICEIMNHEYDVRLITAKGRNRLCCEEFRSSEPESELYFWHLRCRYK